MLKKVLVLMTSLMVKKYLLITWMYTASSVIKLVTVYKNVYMIITGVIQVTINYKLTY